MPAIRAFTSLSGLAWHLNTSASNVWEIARQGGPGNPLYPWQRTNTIMKFYPAPCIHDVQPAEPLTRELLSQPFMILAKQLILQLNFTQCL